MSKQQALDTDPKAIQQISFTVNLERAGNTTMFSLSKNKKNYFEFFTRNRENIVKLITIDLD